MSPIYYSVLLRVSHPQLRDDSIFETLVEITHANLLRANPDYYTINENGQINIQMDIADRIAKELTAPYMRSEESYLHFRELRLDYPEETMSRAEAVILPDGSRGWIVTRPREFS